MTKIAIAILAFAALVYAAFLVLTNRRLPQPAKFSGARRRFILATLLFVGLMMPSSCYTCYAQAPPPPSSRYELGVALEAIWRTLDPQYSEQFRRQLEAAAGRSVIRSKTADMLAVAFHEVAYHKQRTRGKGPQETCYKMTPLGNTLVKTRENALRQVELLREAAESGRIDEQTALKAHAALTREVQMLYMAKAQQPTADYLAGNRLIEQYTSGDITPGDAAAVTAQMIVEMEGGQLPEFTPAKRLGEMKQRVEELFNNGPLGNDWADPAINPNVFAVLQKAGLVKNRPMITCYDRAAAPVQTRSDELKRLQQRLLDKNVKAGILDVEVAEKAAEAAANEQAIDYATEQDIRDYQKKVRRAVRLLYKHGELPSSFVTDIENALDIETVAFDPLKVLRNDARWHLRSLFWQPIGEEVLKALAKRKLIGPPANHRRIMTFFGPSQKLSEQQQKQLAEFTTVLDGGDFALPGDEKVEIRRYMIPRDDPAYRLQIRTVCRALVKTGLVNPARLQALEEWLEIPIVGTLEAG